MKMSVDWEKVYDDYPVNQELIWLNNCGAVPAGIHNVEAVSTYLEGYAKKGFLTGVSDVKKVTEDIKSILSKLFLDNILNG